MPSVKSWRMWTELPCSKEYKVNNGIHEIHISIGYKEIFTGKSFDEVVKKAYKLFLAKKQVSQ